MMMRLSCMLSVFFSVLGTQMSTIAAAADSEADPTAAITAALTNHHQRRNLQLPGAGSGVEGICLNETQVDFSDEDEEFEKIVFAPEFAPTCTCTNESNVEEIFGDFEAQFANSTNITAILEALNNGLALVEVLGEYSCTNGCETCLENGTTCGIFSTTTREYSVGKEGNFTFEFLLELSEDPDTANEKLADTADVEYYTETCIDYTVVTAGDHPRGGKTCYGIDLDRALPDSGGIPCFITYNNDPCKSCILNTTAEDDCVIANCTNLWENANINTCTGQELIGPFVPIKFVTEEITSNEVTKGNCGITAAPITPALTDAPVTPTPVAENTTAPTIAPVTPVPAVTENTTAPNTTAPTDASVTPAPTDSPVTPAPMDAPDTPAPSKAAAVYQMPSIMVGAMIMACGLYMA